MSQEFFAKKQFYLPKNSRSDVWKYFRLIDPNGDRAYCMKCKEQGKIKNFTFESTSQLRRHLQGDHNINLGSTFPAKSQPSLNFVVKKMDMESPRAQKITELIAALITQDLHPVSVVTGSAFQNLLAFFEPS